MNLTPTSSSGNGHRRAPRNALDLAAAWQALLEKFWLVALCFVIGAIVTVAYLNRTPRIYAAAATLQVEQHVQNIVRFEKVQQEDLRFLDMLQTIVQTVSSRPVLERVVQEHDLARVFAPASGIELSPDEAVALLEQALEVRLRRGTRLIDVTVRGAKPALIQKLANSVARQYIKFTFAQQSTSSQAASEFLVEEAQRLKKRLEDSESKLQAYKETVKSISLEDRHDIVTSRLKELSQQVNAAKTARTRLEVEHLQARNLGTNVTALLVLPSVADDPTIASILMSLSKLQNEFSNLRQRYKEEHPKYIQALGQVRDWGRTLTNSVLRMAQTVQAAFENARNSELALEQALRDQEVLALELGKLGVQYNVLQREIESDRALYDSVLTRVKETSLTKDLQSDKARILQLAAMPRRPVFPNTRKVLFMGLFGSLSAGVGLVLGLRSLDTSVSTVDEVEQHLPVPVLAAIEQLRETRNPNKQLVVLEQSHCAGAEAFRSLRTSISMLGRQEMRRTLLFTSALPSEGKTLCAANYALCLAQAGLRTVLIDADLRRPSVERALTGKVSGHPGLTDFLTGQAGLQDILLPSQNERLVYIPSGTAAPNPSELLSQGGFAALIEEALRECDRVVVDSAPIQSVSDTLLLVRHVQTILMVVRAGKTPWKACARAIETVQNAGAPISGIVLNRTKAPRLSVYGRDYSRLRTSARSD